MKSVRIVMTLAVALLFASAAQADLMLTVTGPDEGRFGERVVYEYTILNNGSQAAENIQFSYNLPGLFALDMEAPGTQCDNPVPLPAGTCHAGSLAAGASRQISVTTFLPTNSLSTGASGSVISDAPDANVANNFAQTGTRLTLASGPDLSVTAASDSEAVAPGSTIDVTVTARNQSSAEAASNLLLRIAYTDNFQVANIMSEGWTCQEVESSEGPFIFCRRPELAPESSSPVTVTLLASSDLTYGSVLAVVASEGQADRFWLDNSSTATFSTVPALENLETILLPIVTSEVAGAFGSVWVSDLRVRVTPGAPVTLFPLNETCHILCPPPPTTGFSIEGGTTFEPALFMPQPGAPPALLLYTFADQSERLAFNLRIQDLSRQSQTWGTEIPVVREHEFRTGVIQLLNVPLDERFRQMLRVYDPDGRGTTQVLIRIFSMDDQEGPGSQPLVQTIVTLATPAGVPTASGYPSAPGYVQLADFGNMPELEGVERVRVEVEPVDNLLNPDAEVRIWAFVSVTNNETQHVTTITPQ